MGGSRGWSVVCEEVEEEEEGEREGVDPESSCVGRSCCKSRAVSMGAAEDSYALTPGGGGGDPAWMCLRDAG